MEWPFPQNEGQWPEKRKQKGGQGKWKSIKSQFLLLFHRYEPCFSQRKFKLLEGETELSI
jgi:hypothetical protein